MEDIFAGQLKNLGTDYVDYYLLHILNTKFYNGLDGRGGVVKNCHCLNMHRNGKGREDQASGIFLPRFAGGTGSDPDRTSGSGVCPDHRQLF